MSDARFSNPTETVDLKAQLSHASVDTDPQLRRLLNYVD
jgi:hypothetical protein